MSISDFIQGFIIGSSLIIAIGPQNLYVINQGLKKNYILIVVLLCSLSDSLLIVCGIYLSNSLLNLNDSLIITMKLIGGIWLILYGINKIKNSNSHNIENKEFKELSLNKVVFTTLAITYANPHVYLDTVVLIGSVSQQFSGNEKLFFGVGASFSSFIFFFSLAYGAKLIVPFMKNTSSWRILDFSVAIIMFIISFNLLGQITIQ